MTRTRLAIAAAAAAAAAAVSALAPAAPAAADTAAFTVSYSGSGAYSTTFRAHPPNDGGKDDKNAADDSSRQRWDVRFRHALTIPDCGPPAAGGADPCTDVSGLSGARGATEIKGFVDHRHKDGLYKQLDRNVSCTLKKRTSARKRLRAGLQVRYMPESESFAIRASSPLATTAALFPAQCPQQGDSIDRILDFYAMPGFSFADGYGPDRWFTSREVVIPASRLQGASKLSVRLGDTQAGRPPLRCARPNPSYEKCRTGGSWKGTLTFTRKRASATAAAAHLRRPGGTYTGQRGKLTLSVSRGSIDVAAFDFKCGSTTGRTSLNDIPVKKARGRYRFSIKAHGGVTYRDERPDENATLAFSGHFSPSAGRVVGTLRARTPRCRRNGDVNWSAHR